MSDAIPLPARPNLEQYKKRAKELKKELNKPTLAAAQFLLARQHGFASWPKFAKHVQELARANSTVSQFEAAVDAIVAGDAAKLRKLLRANPGLVRARSSREHRSTLLHYVSANGVEDYRQKTPKNIVAITKILLDAGADVDAESEAYGGGSTTLGLAATSIHPEKAGVMIPLLQALLDGGARLDQPNAGGNAQSVVRACFANGQPEAAKFLAGLGAPVDLEAAAGLGRLEEVQRLMPGSTRRKQEAALFVAAGYGQPEVTKFLLDAGVNPNASNDGAQTPLHWAAYGGHPKTAKLLIERGASIDAKDKQHHATPLDVILWGWANSTEPWEHCYDFVAVLVRAGAKLDEEHWRNPMGAPMLEKLKSDARMQAALKTRSAP